MAKKPNQPTFAVCVANEGSHDLQVWKLYRVLPDAAAAEVGYLRVVDESGEDYLYPAGRFVGVEFPRRWRRSCLPPPRLPADAPAVPTSPTVAHVSLRHRRRGRDPPGGHPPESQKTYCNPINIDYGYCPIPDFVNHGKHRATADPVIVTFRGDYYLFSTNQWGHW